MANSTTAITPGSGANIAVFNDASTPVQSFQRVISSPEPSQKATYFASYKAVSVGTGATTNILTMAGSATKKVTITRLLIGGTAATAASYFDVLLNRQSTADTGGTAATTATIIKADTNNAVATAVAPLFYTAGPTAGTVTGLAGAFKLFAPITGTPAPVTTLELVGAPGRAAQGFVLNGVADVFAVTLNAVTPANATSFDIVCEWVEE